MNPPDVAYGKKLRILNLEDNPSDSKLIQAKLSIELGGMEFSCADNRAAFIQALEEFKPDVILSDYHLPDIDGLTVLKIVRQTHPDIPVIMITGTVSDIQAVELLKEGARDYLLKENLARLVPAVRRVLAEQQEIHTRKLAERSVAQSEQRFRALFNNMLAGYAYCRMFYENNQPHDFTYLEVNAAFEKLTGLKDVVGKKVSEVIPGIRESNPELFEIYSRVASSGTPERFETYVEALKIWFSVSVYSSTPYMDTSRFASNSC